MGRELFVKVNKMGRVKPTLIEAYKIIEWLGFDKKKQLRKCPFVSCNSKLPYCQKFFPHLKRGCPCHKYPLKYIKEIARQLVIGVKE